MKNRGGLSGSGMFLIELLLAVLIFALASAICLRIFVTAHTVAEESSNINHAVIAAQNGAECLKAAGGDINRAAELMGETFVNISGEQIIEIYYDEDWNAVPKGASHAYLVEIGAPPGADESGTVFIDGLTSITNDAGAVPGYPAAVSESAVNVSDSAGGLIFSIPVAISEVAQ